MRRLLILLPLSLSPCTGEPDEAQDSRVVEQRDSMSGPERAKAAADRVRPELERALKEKGLRLGDPVFLRAFKEEKQLEMWVLKRETGKYEHFRSWEIARQSGTPGPKLEEGDNQVPEGFYFVPPARMKPDSTFHLAFNIGYPNDHDRHHGRTGSLIMIHGNQVSIGCLAMTDAKIEEIYTLCDAAHRGGQEFFRVHLFPFRMTAERMEREKESRWHGFWQQLKEGYDYFKREKVPPEVTVELGRYRFR